MFACAVLFQVLWAAVPQDVHRPNSWWVNWNLLTLPDNQAIHEKLFMRGDRAIPQTHFNYMGQSQPVIAIGDKDLALRVLKDNEAYPNAVSKNVNFIRIYAALTSTMLIYLNGELWSKYRSVLQKSFSGTDILQSFKTVANSLCEHIIQPNLGKHLDVMDAFQRTAMDAMGKSLLGVELNTIEGKSTMYEEYRKYNAMINLKVAFYPTSWIDPIIGAVQKFKAHLITQYDAFNLEEHRGSRLLLPVLKEAVENTTIGRLEAIDLMTFMYVAGQETIAITLATLSYYLSKDELREKEGSDLLKNCIKEALRLNTPTFILQARDAKTERDFPAGHRLWILINAIHRNADYFPDPNTFKPHRFNDPENNKLDAWIPFGYGPRMCPGRNFALKEIEEVMKVVLSSYSIHLPANSPHQDYLHCQWSSLLKPKDLKLVFNPLNEPHGEISLAPVPLLPKQLDNSRYVMAIFVIVICYWLNFFL